MIVVLMVIEILLATFAQLLLRQGAMKLGHDELTFAIALEPFRNVFILAGLVLHALSFFLYVFILSKLQLNVLYPIATGATIVLVAGFSVFFFRESLTISQGVGMLAILVGIVLVYLTS
jgi:multidrug transporter EmrE-like cation transporter